MGMFHNPMWTQETIDAWYSSGTYLKVVAGGPSRDRMMMLASERVRFLASHGIRRVFRFLEIGAGSGYLLRAIAKRYGAEVVGTEKDPIRATASGASDPTGKFDLIASVHSLEHMARPLEVLRWAMTMLAPGGNVFIEVPMHHGFLCESHPIAFTPKALATATGMVGLRRILGESLWSDGESDRALYGRTSAEGQDSQ
jgi:2-polyprenyl-3-methyl-5-hydroxy-6-metoxy-1,4-benzoquinol methylase